MAFEHLLASIRKGCKILNVDFTERDKPANYPEAVRLNRYVWNQVAIKKGAVRRKK